ncbi:TPA: hypothetical protein RFW42_004821 [Klebsiella pneumoniae subsp. pneumoniae]|nr:hypothetical protein [Klebsiella pneumoniae subsp. pneumoniae]HDU3724735.1 hypothetical protein [Klebsiella pneumoniae subsp. pneumoniae]HDU3740272.1 hypothetical protein [Klebsiella pneumoniae subsp. pneumoniae]HDU5904437.1 hypothetical protein [Klebsiella pneumoniae subsp. pneumoniae]
MSMIQWGKKSHNQMRISQGVKGGKTSPVEPTLEGADFYDPIAQKWVHEENGLELIRELEGYEAPVADDPEQQERSHEKHFDHGMFSKQYLLDNKVKIGDEARLKVKNSLVGNIQQSETEWDYCQIDMSIFAPKDMPRARKIIIERMSHPKYLAIKDNGPAGMTYVPIDGDRAVFAWGNHLDQDIGAHLQLWRHHHVINNKKLVYDKDLNKIIDKTDDSGNRYITQATSLDKDFIRKIELEWINEGLREAHLPTIDNIYLKNENKDDDKAEAKLRVENEDVSKWQELYDKTVEENKANRKAEIDINFDPNSAKDASLVAELKLLDEVIKTKKELSAEFLAKAIKEKNEVEAFEKAKTTVVALHQEQELNSQLTKKLEDTEEKLLESIKSLEEESTLKTTFENKLKETSSKLIETEAKLGNAELEYENLGKEYDELEKTHTATIEKHKEVVESLNQQLLQQDLDHTNEVELLERTHENVINKLNSEHEKEIETLKTQQASIVSGLNSEITNLKDTVVSITEERDGFKFDKEQLETELAKAKQAIIDMERKHKEELEKRDEEKVSFEKIISDMKEEKIEADKAIKLLTESNEELIKKVDDHINSYKELEVKFKNVETANISLIAENEQLKIDKQALEEAIKKDIEAKNKADNSNKNKPNKK